VARRAVQTAVPARLPVKRPGRPLTAADHRPVGHSAGPSTSASRWPPRRGVTRGTCAQEPCGFHGFRPVEASNVTTQNLVFPVRVWVSPFVFVPSGPRLRHGCERLASPAPDDRNGRLPVVSRREVRLVPTFGFAARAVARPPSGV
jgi:hypothetical protein